MLEALCSHKGSIGYILALGYVLNSALEFYIGRTDRVKANSIWELILTGAAAVGRFIFKKGE